MKDKVFMKSNFTKNILKSLAILLACALPAGCSDKEADEPYEDGNEDIELTAEQEAYTTLAGNFFQSSQPSKGCVLDESKPSERSEIAETYESALEDFERYLPSNEREASFINRTSDGISVDLGDLGSVRFEAFTGDGVVAKVTVALEDLPRYTVLYRSESSFGDNSSSNFSVGDLVRFTCPVHNKYGVDCNTPTVGVVIQTGSPLTIFTRHTHVLVESDHWKTVCFDYDLVSLEGWKAIYNAWKNNRELIMDTYKHTEEWNISGLVEIMDGDTYHEYVCVDGNGLYSHQERYWFYYTWYSKARRLSIKDLRNGIFSTDKVDYAFRKETKDIDCYYFSLLKVDGYKVETIYPNY